MSISQMLVQMIFTLERLSLIGCQADRACMDPNVFMICEMTEIHISPAVAFTAASFCAHVACMLLRFGVLLELVCCCER